MTIRKSTHEDIPRIMNIIDDAKIYLKENHIDQWQNGYPNSETIQQDIDQGISYVVCDNNNIVGTFMAQTGEDITYKCIYDGAWLTSDTTNYTVIHRIAIDSKHKGKRITSFVMDYVAKESSTCDSLRIDTHEDNISMQKALLHHGFTHCGTIYLLDGAKRFAYEKLLN